MKGKDNAFRAYLLEAVSWVLCGPDDPPVIVPFKVGLERAAESIKELNKQQGSFSIKAYKGLLTGIYQHYQAASHWVSEVANPFYSRLAGD